MADLTNTQMQNLLANIFIKNEVGSSAWYAVSCAGFQKYNWLSNYTLNSNPMTGNSGVSVGAVQFDFASGNFYANELRAALIQNLSNVGEYSLNDLDAALQNFHARNIAGYTTLKDQQYGNFSQAVADEAFKQLQVITAYAPYISDALQNNSNVNAVLNEGTNAQIATNLIIANNAFNSIQATLSASGKSSVLLSALPEQMVIAFADMNNQKPGYLTSATNWLITHPDATWKDFRDYNQTSLGGRGVRIDNIESTFDGMASGVVSLDASPLSTVSSTTSSTTFITDSTGNIIGYAVASSDSAGNTAIATTLTADGSIVKQTFSDGITLTTTQGGITTTTDIATGVTTADISGIGSSLPVYSDGTINAGGYLINLPSDPLADIFITTAGGPTFTIPAGASITSNGESLIVQNDGIYDYPSQMIQRDGSGVQFNYDAAGAYTGASAIGANSSFSDMISSVAKSIGQAVLDFLLPSAYGSEMISNAGGSTVTFTSSDGAQSSISYDTNGSVSGITAQTSDIGGVESTITADAATGITTIQDYDSATGQLLSSTTIDITTDSGTTLDYTNGILSSQTDFGPDSAITTTYNANGTVSGVETINADNTRSSVQYDNQGNIIYKTSTDVAGAVTITTIDPATRIESTQYPDGALSTKTGDGYDYSSISTMRPDGTMEIVTNDYGIVTSATSYADGSSLVTTTNQDGIVTYAATTNPDGSGSTVSYNPDGSGTTTSYGADGSNSITDFNGDGSLARVETTQADGTLNITNYGANNVIASTAASYADGSGATTILYPNGNTKEQWFTNADGTGSHTTYSTDGSTGTFEVSNADGSSSTGGYNADGSSWATVRNADGCGGVIFVEAANDTEWRVAA